jgi:Pentapeptide repeats (8 copies)
VPRSLFARAPRLPDDLRPFDGAGLAGTRLPDARLRDVRFERCDLSGASFARARLERVELVDCRLAGVRSITDLRGASMPWDDVVGNAVAMAAALGIRVLEED